MRAVIEFEKKVFIFLLFIKFTFYFSVYVRKTVFQKLLKWEFGEQWGKVMLIDSLEQHLVAFIFIVVDQSNCYIVRVSSWSQ